jgi:hypothetical protein
MRGGGEIVGISGWLDEIREKVDRARANGDIWLSLETELPSDAASGHRQHESVEVLVQDVVAIRGLRSDAYWR